MFERDVRMVEYARGILGIRLDTGGQAGFGFLQQSGCFSAEHGKRGYGLLCVSPANFTGRSLQRRRLEDVYMQFATPKKLQKDSELNYWR